MQGFFKPFLKLKKEALGKVIKNRSSEQEEVSFIKAMEGVKPLSGKEKFYCVPQKSFFFKKERQESIWPNSLKIRIQDTSEYVEELVWGEGKEWFEGLHAGLISVSRVLNLHRLRVSEAQEAFHYFLKESLMRGDHCILIIHGRGRSSKGEPILKNKVHEWLRKGPFRRYIIGFCSARQCDGGTGATYVLLSPRPLKKRKICKL